MRTNRKNLTSDELALLKLTEDNELLLFDFERIKSLTSYSGVELQDILSRLTKKYFFFRIEKSKYCIRNFRNPYVIANALHKDSAIAYWSALNLHHLTEQIPNVVFSQSDLQKKDKKVFNVRYKFVKVKTEKVCGIMQMGFGNERFRVTDVEKTLLDCFDLPQYSGGYEELIRAFYEAKISSTKLLAYGKQMNNISVLKRLAFLSDLFDMNTFRVFQTEVQKMVKNRYTLLDPMGEDAGEFISKWKIRVNIPREKLLEIIKKMY